MCTYAKILIEMEFPYSTEFAAISLQNLCNTVANMSQQCCCNFCATYTVEKKFKSHFLFLFQFFFISQKRIKKDKKEINYNPFFAII